MSVEKVNKYKEEKKNRKEILEKEKKKKKLYRIGGWVVGLAVAAALVAMLGLTARNSYNKYLASQPNYESDSLVISDMTGILDELESDGADGEEEAADGTEAVDESKESDESVEDATGETSEETKAE